MSDDTEDFVTEVTLGTNRTSVKKVNDDTFGMSYDKVHKLIGLSNNFKRKAARKAKCKAGTKQIEPDMVDGYTYLDCVIPPENLNSLAKLYDLSPAHHSAVDAKVAAMFGLGWQLVESSKFKRTKERTRTESGLKKADDQFNMKLQVMLILKLVEK
jgi:hypothetical protein